MLGDIGDRRTGPSTGRIECEAMGGLIGIKLGIGGKSDL